MLAHQWHSDSGIPVVFLHGFLGSRHDWQEVIGYLQKFPQIRPLVIDLPFHHQSSHIACHHFDEMRTLFHATLQQLGEENFYLVGYSLGGRIVLDYALNVANPYLKGVLLEGANIGLATQKEKEARWQNDCVWAERFATEPLRNVLKDWYQQAVFSDLNFAKRHDIIEKRLDNDGKSLAQMLKATSLAKQSYFAPKQIKHSASPIKFIIGERDQKFRQMVEQHQLAHHLIPNAGHNAHIENPQAFAEYLVNFILP
ncbi:MULTISPECIES: 2-succinyl-6-hydroxy-2,4-cyclohexadiene-1-carboxylate synthase [Glaesserella]|uniref:Putative 2-succinyl-6-hydroxy-2,4-cyclohexadiene-1-carboxylate synthase n=1 Tax=Glaesserella australis TaxID=2094024 RepID=A0A328BZ26_9PAST|nr:MULTISPECIES: 2-succinyl-6-hydroxy-2,4-cyclohexadiene-1-carboxylate synthase [Glaesserella]AUI67017.1 2-succinyl-6-hydroxy-2,4-cyclohexadiene-1-carboxylate synthase [Glaesserella sp. 15-184]RAL18891.1 2-succinyl-6-hydroxy-2,4-cyclohexadiene-1-carboxylate synthase [Glaesserella australis]